MAEQLTVSSTHIGRQLPQHQMVLDFVGGGGGAIGGSSLPSCSQRREGAAL